MGQLGILGATIKGQSGSGMSAVIRFILVYILAYSCILLYILAYSCVLLYTLVYSVLCGRVWLCWCFFCGIRAYCKGGGEVRDGGGWRGEGGGWWRGKGWRSVER